MCADFLDRVKNRAYYKYLDRKNHNKYDDSMADWVEAEIEEGVENKILEEAYLNYTKYGSNDLNNYVKAKNDVMNRIRFLAYYIHEKKYNQKPIDNWVEAEKIYINDF